MDDADTVSEQVIIEITASAFYDIDPANFLTIVTIADDDAPPGPFTLSAPGNYAMGVDITPRVRLEWTVSVGATSYHLVLADNASFDSPIRDDDTITTNIYDILTGLNYGAVYWWKVTAVNAIDTVEATVTPFQFTTAYGTPLITIETTSDAAEPSTPGVFTVTRSVGDPTDPLTVYYEVNIIASSAVAGQEYVALSGTVEILGGELTAEIAVMPMDDADSTDEELIVALIDDLAYDLDPISGATMTIGDDDIVPRAFDLLLPTTGSTGVSLTPTLTWQTALGAADYVVVVDDNSDWSSPEFGVTVTTTSCGVPAYYLAGLTEYYWKVTGTNRIGTTEATNAPFTFTTEADTTPPTVKSTSPEGGDTKVSISTDIRITFSEPMDWPYAANIVTVTCVATGPVAGTESLSVNERAITFKPTEDLVESTIYSVTVLTDVRDVALNPLAVDHTFDFTTEAPLSGLATGPGCLPSAGSALGLVTLAAALALIRRRRPG